MIQSKKTAKPREVKIYETLFKKIHETSSSGKSRNLGFSPHGKLLSLRFESSADLSLSTPNPSLAQLS